MEGSWKVALRKWNSYMRTGIIVQNFLPDLHKDAGGFFTDVEYAQVRSMNDNVKQVDELVDVLTTKEKVHFDAFCTILERNGFGPCAKKLKETAGISHPVEGAIVQSTTCSLPRSLEMDLVLCDTAAFESRQDPQKVIKDLYFNAYQCLIRILDPYFELIKAAALRAMEMGQVEKNEGVRSAVDVDALLQHLGVTWVNVLSLQRAITCIPAAAVEERATAHGILCHYRAHYKEFCKATKILNGGSVLCNQACAKFNEDFLTVIEVTVKKDPEQYTCDDCLEMWTKFLIEELEIPKENVRFVKAKPSNSTMILFQVSQQYTMSIKEKLTKGNVVCVMIQLDILRVRIPEICDVDLRTFTPQELSASIRDGLKSGVDFISLTQAIPYAVEALVDPSSFRVQPFAVYPDDVEGEMRTGYTSPVLATITDTDSWDGSPHISTQTRVLEEPHFGTGISSHDTLSTSVGSAGATVKYFGPRQPPLTNFIKNLLQRYTDGGQILKELIQNADDAGASKVKFLIDSRQHPRDPGGLWKPSLAPFQGPALLAWNNSVFRDSDWENIGKLQQSQKEEELFKVGRFGLGFQSVHHLTDLPIIASGSYVALMDPHETILDYRDSEGARLTGKQFTMEELRQYPGQVAALDGILGFTSSSSQYKGTLFRFPFRNGGFRSRISDHTYSREDALRKLYDSLAQEAHRVLLFLNHVTEVELYDCNPCELGQPLLRIAVNSHEVQGSRAWYISACTAFSQNQDHADTYLNKCTVTVEGPLAKEVETGTSSWLMCSTIGVRDRQVVDLASRLKVIPWVGLAAPLPPAIAIGDIRLQDQTCLQPNCATVENQVSRAVSCYRKLIGWTEPPSTLSNSGFAFCFLPMSTTTSTGLPVHIHGYFTLSDNRRRVRWPDVDDKGVEANWNKHLVEHLIAPSYAILMTARCMMTSYQGFPLEFTTLQKNTDPFALLPVMSDVWGEVWKHLIQRVLPLLSHLPILWTAANNGMWVKPPNAYFVPLDTLVPTSIVDLLLQLNCPIVCLPRNVQESCTTLGCKLITPDVVRDYLRRDANAAKGVLAGNRHLLEEILRYVFSNGTHNLQGLPLVPLQQAGSVGTFFSLAFYVLPKNDKLASQVLHGLESQIVSISLPSDLQAHFIQMATFRQYSLQLATADMICPNLLSAAINSWSRNHNATSITWSPSQYNQPPASWLSCVWRYIADNGKLQSVAGLPLIATTGPDAIPDKDTVTLYPLNSSGNTVLRKTSASSKQMQGIAETLGSTLVNNSHLYEPFSRELDQYLPILSSATLFNALQLIPNVVRTVAGLNIVQKGCLRNYLADAVSSSTGPLNGQQITFLQSLPVYEIGVGNQSVTFVQLGYNSQVIFPHYSILFPNNLAFPSQIVKVSEDDQQLLQTVLQRPPLSFGDLVQQHIFNHAVTQCNTEMRDQLLIWIIQMSQPQQNGELEQFIRKTACIPASDNTLCRVDTLYDPEDSKLQEFFHTREGKSPSVDFKPVFHKLIQFGLSTWHTVTQRDDTFRAFLQERSQSVQFLLPLRMEKEARQRSKLILQTVANHAQCQYLLECVQRQRFLFCQQSPPSGYPEQLHWAGRGAAELVSPSDVCASSDLFHLASLVGSVCPILDSTYTDSVRRLEQCNIMACFRSVTDQHVLQHFTNITNLPANALKSQPSSGRMLGYASGGQVSLDGMVEHIYEFLSSDHSKCFHKWTRPCIWNSEQCLFVDKSKVALRPLDGCSLAPYRYSIQDLSCLMRYENMWCASGVKDHLTIEDGVQVISEIRASPDLLITRDLDIVVNVANCLKKNKKVGYVKDMYLPSKSCRLHRPEDLTYHDHYLDMPEAEKGVNFVHPRITSDVACFFGVMSLSIRAAPSQPFGIDYEYTGPYQSITDRIKELVEDYEDSIDVFKELIQNADDAGATEVKFLIDWRTHKTGKLLTKGMAKWQGPALYAYNNNTFSDEDLQNISKLAGATKKQDHTKIGRFGVGFCATYHLTDVPSFITRRWLQVFDPHLKYLEDRVQPNKPGMQIDFVKQREGLKSYFSDQVEPYKGVFGCDVLDTDQNGFNGTLFRFPFRQQGIVSDISPEVFTEGSKTIESLKRSLFQNADTLLLFLQNVNKVELFECQTGDSLDKMQKLLQVTRSNPDGGTFERQFRIPREHFSSVRPCSQKMKIVTSVGNGKQQPQEAMWEVSSAMGRGASLQHANSQDGQSQGLVPVAEVAVRIKKEGQLIAVDSTQGAVSCFLPLPIETSLNFVVNAFFDVSKDRRLLKGVQGSSHDNWNVMLMKDALVDAVFTLLVALTELAPVEQPDALKEFLQSYYSLFPTEYVSRQTDGVRPYLADGFVERLPLEQRKVIWSECDGGCFLKPSDVVVLSPEFDKEPFTNAEKQFVHSLLVCQDICVAEVPFGIRDFFKQITFEEFCHQYFFGNIQTVSLETRDSLVLFILKHLFSLMESHPWLKQLVQNTACIPSKPSNALFKPDFLVDPTCKLLASLYDESEGRFPVDQYSDQSLTTVLHFLGMSHDKLRSDDVLDRAKSVQQVLRSEGADKAQQRSQALVIYLMECHFKPYKQYSGFTDLSVEDKRLTEQLNTEPFLLAMPRPMNTTLPWFMAKKNQFSAAECLYASRCKHLVFIRHEVMDDQAYSDHLSDLEHILAFRQKPALSEVLEQLKGLISWWTEGTGKQSGSPEDISTISATMKSMYGHIKNAVFPYTAFPKKEIDKKALNFVIAQLKDVPFIWQGDFYRVDQVFWEESCDCPPYLVKLHPVDVDILTELGVTNKATNEQLLLTLKAIAVDHPDQPVSDKIVDFACYAANHLELSDDVSVTSLFLPDKQQVMRHSSQLFYHDDRDYSWLERHQVFQDLTNRQETAGYFHLHPEISWSVAKDLGLNNPAQALLSKFSDQRFVKGLDFGQHEDLCDRLSSILKGYQPDTSIFKEFVQNADDAGASEIAFILDERVFSDRHLLSDSNNWKQLQKMPSLLVFNNRKFTDQDLEGITKLGRGGKQDTPETIGRFGIGFNVAYHVTDCPMFVSHKEGGQPEHFCVFDPTLNFAPDSTTQVPGERWQLGTEQSDPGTLKAGDTLCSVFDSQFEPFSEDLLQSLSSNCKGTFADMNKLDKWPNGFVMFRLPLTRDRSESVSSTIVPVGPALGQRAVRGCEMEIGLLQKLLNNFSKEASHTLLFLNSVRKISIFEVSVTNRCNLIGSYHAALSVTAELKCKKFETCVRQGTECLSVGGLSDNIHEVYEVPVESMSSVLMSTPDASTPDVKEHQLMEDTTTWVVSKRFGGQDLNESLLKTGFKCSFLPLGGVAAACLSKEQSSQQSGRVFCYLPLPLDSHLPVHVNGHFWLSDSRRDLQRGSSYHDLKDWNKSMSNDVICKAYAELLLYCRRVQVTKEDEDGAQNQQLDREWYYNLFPQCNITGPLEDFRLPEQLYCYLLDNSAEVLLYRSNQLQSPTWLQLANLNGPQKGWFYSKRCGLSSQTLLKLGMKLTYAPLVIANSINTSLQHLERDNRYEGEVTPAVVREHLKSLCSQRDTFKNVIVEAIVPLLAYCLSDVPTADQMVGARAGTDNSQQLPPPKWQDFLEGVPLLLTQDGQLQTMHEVFDGKFTNLLPKHCEHLFIHEALWKNSSVCEKLLSLGVIKKLAKYPELVAEHLQLPRTDKVIDLSEDCRKLLAQFWTYLDCVELERRGVFSHFSVIPTIDNKLHPLSRGKHILFEEPEMSLTKSLAFPVVDFGRVFGTEAGEFAQYRHFEYVFAKSNNANDILQMLQWYKSDLKQKSIHPKEEEVMEFVRFLQASIAIKEVQTTIPWLKELPLFILVSGELQAIDEYRHAHGVPTDLPRNGLDDMSRAANIAFLVVPPFCAEFMKKVGVTVWSETSLELYSNVLVPLFSNLPHDQTPDLLQQHIESVFRLFKIVRYSKKTKSTWNAMFWKLKSVPFLQTPNGPTCAADLYDYTVPLFKAFLSADKFPPSPWDDDSDPERLEFLGHLGLHRQVSTDDWLRFAQSLAQDVQRMELESVKEEEPCIEKATLLLNDLAERLVDPQQVTMLSDSFLVEASSICCVPCRIDHEPHETLKQFVPSCERSGQKWTTLQNSVLLRTQADYQLACLHKPVLPACFSPELPRASESLKKLSVIELNAVVVAHNLKTVAQILQQCHELPTRRRFALVRQLAKLFRAHYEYLNGFEGDGAPISAALCDCRCIFFESRQGNFSSFQLLSADMVCGNVLRGCNLYPYVREVPSSCQPFKTFLKLAGVSDSLKVSQCLHILRQLHKKKTDPNDKRLAEQAYISLVKLTREEEKEEVPELELFQSGNIPLLSMDNKLVDASQLVLDDALWLKDRLDLRSVNYQVVKTPPQDDYRNITLPQCLGVRLLSSIISEHPHIDMENEHIVCNEEQVAWSEGREHGCKHVMKLQEIMQSDELFNGILRVYKYETQKPPTDEQAVTVQVRLRGVKVKCVQMIKTVLHDELGQELPNSATEDILSWVWKENSELSEATAFISPHQQSVDMDDLLYDLAQGINQHMGGVIKNDALLIRMLVCDSPEVIPVVLNRSRIPMYEHGTEKEPLMMGHGELVQRKEYLDNIIICSYWENEIVKYYSLDCQLINAQVVNITEDSGDTEEDGLSACKLHVGPGEENTADLPLAQLFISKYLQPQQATRIAKEWGLVVEEDDSEEAPSEPLSILELSIESDEDLKVQLEGMLSQLNTEQVQKTHIFYASQRLAYHLHYLCTRTKSPAFRRLSEVLLRAAEPHLEPSELQKLQETVRELLNETPPDRLSGGGGYGGQMEAYPYYGSSYGGSGSHRRRHGRGGGGGGGGGTSSLWRGGYRNRDALWQRLDEEPLPQPNMEHAEMWLIQALNDYEAAKSLLTSSQEKLQREGDTVDAVQVFPAQVCFLAHESVEKCLKTLFLALCGLDRMLSEQTNVRDLCQELQGNTHWPKDPPLDLMPQVLQVSRHYLRCRYPDYNTPIMAPVLAYMQHFEEAEEVVAAVESILTTVRSLSCISPMMESVQHSVPARRRTPLDPAQFPQEWLPFAEDEKLKVVPLRQGSPEYNSIAELFLSSMGVRNVTIFNIERIQNVYLWRDFINRRNAILERQGGYCREEKLFHGTSSVDPKKIYSGQKSFDVVQSAQGLYGRGIYFAKDASLSHQGYVFRRGNMFYLLVAQVVLGDTYVCLDPGQFKGHGPPEMPQQEGGVTKSYDSIEGRLHGRPIYTVDRNDMTYPAYQIIYKLNN